MRILRLLLGWMVAELLCLSTPSLHMAATAFPIGAGGCASGRAAVAGAHTSSNVNGNGSLTDGGLVMHLAGRRDVTPGSTITLLGGFEYTATLATTLTASAESTSSAFFRGVLLRFDGSTPEDMLIPTESASDLQIAAVCDTTGGVTHKSNTDKTSVTTQFFLEPGQNITLDITVVRTLVPSVYYYSSFLIQGTSSPSLATILNAESDLSIFTSILDKTGLVDVILGGQHQTEEDDADYKNDEEQNITTTTTTATTTLFAPTNDAMASFTNPSLLDTWLAAPANWKLQWRALLLFHVAPGYWTSDLLTQGQRLATASHPLQHLVITVNDQGLGRLRPTITLSGEDEDADGSTYFTNSTIVQADLLAPPQGVVHKVNQLLFPTVLTLTVYDLTNDQVPRLAKYIVQAGLDSTLASLEAATVFAPRNLALATLPNATQQALFKDGDIDSEADPAALTTWLLHHVVADVWPLHLLATDGMTLTTLANTTLMITVLSSSKSTSSLSNNSDTNTTNNDAAADHDKTVLVNDVKIRHANQLAGNGLLHIMEDVLPNVLGIMSNDEDAAAPFTIADNDDDNTTTTATSTTMTTTTMSNSNSSTSTGSTGNLTCYTNTTLLNQAMLALTINDTSTWQYTFVLCPNTVFVMGDESNPTGQAPCALRSNMMIQCGASGSSSNNCTLTGGSMQVVSLMAAYNEQVTVQDMIQGLTLEYAANVAVWLNNAGSISIIDCIFRVRLCLCVCVCVCVLVVSHGGI